LIVVSFAVPLVLVQQVREQAQKQVSKRNSAHQKELELGAAVEAVVAGLSWGTRTKKSVVAQSLE
jgi:hypothetical protein